MRKGKAKSAKLIPLLFNLKNRLSIIAKAKVNTKSKTEANFIKIITILYHKN